MFKKYKKGENKFRLFNSLSSRSVALDERSAGFITLGMSRAALLHGRCVPAAVVTTSGTTVANLHPAVLEADAAGVPLCAPH